MTDKKDFPTGGYISKDKIIIEDYGDGGYLVPKSIMSSLVESMKKRGDNNEKILYGDPKEIPSNSYSTTIGVPLIAVERDRVQREFTEWFHRGDIAPSERSEIKRPEWLPEKTNKNLEDTGVYGEKFKEFLKNRENKKE